MKNKRLLTVIFAAAAAVSFLTSCDSPDSSSENSTLAGDTLENVYDPYAEENVYDIPDSYFEERSGVDYGTMDYDVTYYSSTAGDDKKCNVLLPAGYDKNKSYPVMYIYHGFGGSYSDQLYNGSYLNLLYGNMLADGLAEPQIIVNVDMYTDKQEDKDSMSDEELRYSYDKVIDDVANDLMPFIEKNYSVKKGRENTAIAGMSEGGAKSLCTGFKWLDKFGYIAAFAPDENVIPIGDDYMDSFWTVPYFKDGFPKPEKDNMPYYVYMSVGSYDPWNVDATLFYHDTLDDMNVKNQTDKVDGFGHNYIFWRQCFYNFLKKTFH